ncbi:hypothetical protein EV281_105325 [Rhizobium sp. BK418]|nr:hypothetical protein EV281_105325 [Rhizobium sp. BK418]
MRAGYLQVAREFLAIPENHLVKNIGRVEERDFQPLSECVMGRFGQFFLTYTRFKNGKQEGKGFAFR